MLGNSAPAEHTPARPMTFPDHSLGLSFYFEIAGFADALAIEKLVTDSAPVIRRYLDDPISAQTIGHQPDPRRNAFLALLLAIDRAGFERGTLSVLPAQPACQPAAHAGAGGYCPFCGVLSLLAGAQREKLIRIRKVAGDKDAGGRYINAADVAIEPGFGLEEWRERIKRLSLPTLLSAAAPAAPARAPAGGAKAKSKAKAKAPPAPGLAGTVLAVMRVSSWAELAFSVQAESFQLGDITGAPADLGLDAAGWQFFHEVARARGHLQPAVLGGLDWELNKRVARLSAALKRAFPQIQAEPFENTGAGFKSRFNIQPGDLLEDHWGA